MLFAFRNVTVQSKVALAVAAYVCDCESRENVSSITTISSINNWKLKSLLKSQHTLIVYIICCFIFPVCVSVPSVRGNCASDWPAAVWEWWGSPQHSLGRHCMCCRWTHCHRDMQTWVLHWVLTAYSITLWKIITMYWKRQIAMKKIT